MKIQIKVIAKSRKESVEKIGENYYKVKVTAPPEKGKANEAVREVLAKHFGVKKYNVEITSGLTIPDKFVRISE